MQVRTGKWSTYVLCELESTAKQYVWWKCKDLYAEEKERIYGRSHSCAWLAVTGKVKGERWREIAKPFRYRWSHNENTLIYSYGRKMAWTNYNNPHVLFEDEKIIEGIPGVARYPCLCEPALERYHLWAGAPRPGLAPVSPTWGIQYFTTWHMRPTISCVLQSFPNCRSAHYRFVLIYRTANPFPICLVYKTIIKFILDNYVLNILIIYNNPSGGRQLRI